MQFAYEAHCRDRVPTRAAYGRVISFHLRTWMQPPNAFKRLVMCAAPRSPLAAFPGALARWANRCAHTCVTRTGRAQVPSLPRRLRAILRRAGIQEPPACLVAAAAQRCRSAGRAAATTTAAAAAASADADCDTHRDVVSTSVFAACWRVFIQDKAMPLRRSDPRKLQAGKIDQWFIEQWARPGWPTCRSGSARQR